MAASQGKTVDVLIGSPKGSFWDAVSAILKGYYPYVLHKAANIDQVMEGPEGFSPMLALVDGSEGTAVTNEWVQATKMTYPDCNIIVLHSSAPLDFDVVKKNGASEVMHLLFDREFISDMILQLAPVEMDGDQIPITALMPVDLRDIEPDSNINFNVFVHLPSNHRSVLMRKAGDVLDEARVEKFKNMHQQMYIRKTEMKAFFEYSRTVMTMRNLPMPISMTEKFHRSKKAIYEIMAQFLNASSNDYSQGKVILEKCNAIIADFEFVADRSQEELVAEVCRFTNNIRTYYHDCICVSAYGAYFAQLLGLDTNLRMSAALAGLLHNIGMSQMSFPIYDRKVDSLTPDELKDFHLYPERSATMVKAKKVSLTPEISDAIIQHRENCMGTGFPKNLNKDNTSELSKLLSLAYAFHEMTALREGQAALSPFQAIETLSDNALSGSGEYDLRMATGLKKKFKK